MQQRKFHFIPFRWVNSWSCSSCWAPAWPTSTTTPPSSGCPAPRATHSRPPGSACAQGRTMTRWVVWLGHNVSVWQCDPVSVTRSQCGSVTMWPGECDSVTKCQCDLLNNACNLLMKKVVMWPYHALKNALGGVRIKQVKVFDQIFCTYVFEPCQF